MPSPSVFIIRPAEGKMGAAMYVAFIKNEDGFSKMKINLPVHPRIFALFFANYPLSLFGG
jgi:hypothetical protein